MYSIIIIISGATFYYRIYIAILLLKFITYSRLKYNTIFPPPIVKFHLESNALNIHTEKDEYDISLIHINNCMSGSTNSNVSFLAIEAHISGKPYDIPFTNIEYSLGVVGNIINYEYIRWYINNNHNMSIIIADIDNVTILTEDLSIYNIKPNQHLVIDQDTYSINYIEN
jgi:hypothetical protein